MRSLHGNLVRAIILTLSLVLVAGGVTTYQVIGQVLEQELDRVLFRDLCNATPKIVLDMWLRQGPGEFAGGAGLSDPGLLRGVWLQAWDGDGRTIVHSPHLGERSLPRLARTLEATPLADPGVGSTVVQDLPFGDRTLRGIAARIRVPARHAQRFEPGTARRSQLLEVVLAHDRAAVDAPLSTLRWLILTVGLGCLAVAAWTAYRVVNSGLRPLDELRDQLESLDHERLDRRIRLDDAPAELVPVRDQLNELIERLRRGFRREQEFAASAAHEMRTPLAGLRATIEVALQRPRSADAYREDLQTCHGLVVQMQSTIEMLLELVREQPRLPAQDVVLDDLLERCRRSLADPDRVRLAGSERPVTAPTIPDILERVVSNVLENAVEHGTPGSAVEVGYRRDADRVVIETRNPVESIPADLEDRAFDAFWRADGARADARHVGLGLSLSRTLIGRLGGSIALRVLPGPEVLVRIELPSGDRRD